MAESLLAISQTCEGPTEDKYLHSKN